MNSYLFASNPGSVEKCLHHMKRDILKGEKRLCIDEHDMSVHGLCYHGHLNGISMEIQSEECCFALRSLIVKRRRD
jgi:hypothetical protein